MFWGIISGLLTGYTYKVLWHFWLFFHGRDGENSPFPPREEIWDISEGDFSQFGKKKKHYQTVPKARFARQIFSPKTSFARPKFVCERFASLAKNCLQLARRLLSSRTCVCGVSVKFTIVKIKSCFAVIFVSWGQNSRLGGIFCRENSTVGIYSKIWDLFGGLPKKISGKNFRPFFLVRVWFKNFFNQNDLYKVVSFNTSFFL
jgi:hypothetical protein